MRIFVVENHEDTLVYLTLHLKHSGHQVGTATGVESAMLAIRAGEWDLLLSDLNLPDGDACDILGQLEDRKPVVAVVMSGSTRPQDKLRCHSIGFHFYLIKPFLPEELDEVLRQAAALLNSVH